jgi:hypothetical protein
MSLPLDFLASLSQVTIEEIMTRTKEGRREGAQRSFLELRNELKPLELFCYFGARFGPPNGIQNLLRNDHSDNLVHWDWTLKYQENLFFFWGTNFRTDLTTIGDLKFTEPDKAELVLRIRADFKNFGPQMSEVRKMLEHWTEFVNPYWRLTRAITSLRKELAQLNLMSEFSDNFNTPSTAVKDSKRWEKISNSYSKAFGLCFGIRSMLPVKAEAFVNLLVFIQARPDIKADARLLDSIFRQQIDVRVKSLHINCLGFEKAVDYANPACKRFHTLINERNDLLHGNVVPEKEKFNEVYFLGNVPVFKEYRSLWDRTLAVDSKSVGLERLENEITTVNEFVEYVLLCLKPKVGELIRSVINKRDLAKNSEDGRFGILFPDHLIDSRPVFEKGDDSTPQNEEED